MLQNIGDKLQSQRWLAFGLLGVLAIIFAAWGAYGIVDMSLGAGTAAAKVNGEEIRAEEVNRAWQAQQPQLMRAFGGELSPGQRDALQARLLDSFIRDAVVRQQAEHLGFTVSDAQLRRAYESETAFQEEGKFSKEVAIARLAAAGITPAAFEADERRTLLMNQVAGVIQGTAFLTPKELERYHQLQDEERELRFALLTPQQFAGTAPIEPAAIEAWYKAHSAQYQTTESVRLSYAELSLADVAAQMSVTEAQARERYEKTKDHYVEPERRQARHILITAEKPEDDAKAAAQAEAIYQQVIAGKDFAELAKANSKDPGSAAKGGDLGWAEKSAYVPAFADALFAMKEGEVSKPVKTQFGYHIIKLEGVKPGVTRSFEQAREEIETALKRELAGDKFGEAQEQLQQRVERGAGSFDELVKTFALKPGEIDNFQRGAGGAPLGADPALDAAVFSDRLLTQHQVGGPLALGEDRLVIFRVLEHRPAQTKPLAEVQASIVAELTRQRGAAAAQKAGEEALKRLDAGEAFDKVIADLKVKSEPAKFVSRQTRDLPVQLRAQVFAAARPEAGKPVDKLVMLDEGGVALAQITSTRIAPAPSNPQLAQLQAQRELQDVAERESQGYLAALMSTAKVSRNLKVLQ